MIECDVAKPMKIPPYLGVHTVLAKATGSNCAAGEGRVNVTVKDVVSGEIKYVFVHRAHESSVGLEDGDEQAPPDADISMWLIKKVNIVFFILAHVFSVCDFFTAIRGHSFLNMFLASLKALRSTGLLPSAIIVHHAGRLAIQ